MNYKQFVGKFRMKLTERLIEKTSWGRNEVMRLFDDACIEMLAEAMDEELTVRDAQQELDSFRDIVMERELTSQELVRKEYLLNFLRQAGEFKFVSSHK
jgi:hypothetical protein